MTEYIDREKVLALQTDLHFDNIEQLKHWKCRHIDPTDVLLLPAADVRPVIHAKWIDGGCSACNFFVDCFDAPDFSFCPNCGANMRGGEAGE